MRLLRLRLENFGPFVEPLDLPLDRQGLISVVGDNGVGKSSILDGLLWTLGGETGPRKDTATSDSGLKSDDVVNETSQNGCITGVDFEGVDGVQYTVERWRKVGGKKFPKPSGVRLLRGTEVVADLDAPNVQEEINARLGFDHELACRLLVRSQEDTFSFTQSAPAARFALLTAIEGLSELDEWDGKFRARSREVDLDLGAARGQITAQTQALEMLMKERPGERAHEWEAARSQRAARALQAIEQHDARAGELRALANTMPMLAERLAQASAVAPDPAKPADLVAWESRLTEVGKTMAVAGSHQSEAEARENRGLTLGVGNCGMCGQELTPGHLEQHRALLRATTDMAKAEVAAAKAAYTETADIVRKGQADWAAHLAALAAARAAHNQEVGRLQMEHLGAQRAAANLTGLLTERARLVMLHDQEVRSTNPLLDLAAKNEARQEEVKVLLAQHRQADAALSTESGLIAWWLKAIPAMKAWIFDTAVIEITNEANRWLQIFTQGIFYVVIETIAITKAGEQRDKVALRVFRRLSDGTTAERPFRKLSGGEKRRVSLAIEWALAARVQHRAKTRCSFLALDEVDRHLDDAGRAGLREAFNVLKKEKDTILFVSHDGALRSSADQRWVVTKRKEASTVEIQT